jgi:hypothetical protein
VALDQLQEYLHEVEQERMAEAAMSKLASVHRGQNSNIQ